MYAVNNSDIWREGCRNSQLLIADRVDTTGMFEFVNLMPRFPIPEDFESEDALFADAVWKGMAKRYPNGIDDTRRKQAEYEIMAARRANCIWPVERCSMPPRSEAMA